MRLRLFGLCAAGLAFGFDPQMAALDAKLAGALERIGPALAACPRSSAGSAARSEESWTRQQASSRPPYCFTGCCSLFWQVLPSKLKGSMQDLLLLHDNLQDLR